MESANSSRGLGEREFVKRSSCPVGEEGDMCLLGAYGGGGGGVERSESFPGIGFGAKKKAGEARCG